MGKATVVQTEMVKASNCIMGDGETSVEDEFNYSTDEQYGGKWIDGSNWYYKTIDFGALPNGTAKNVAHNISNLKEVLNYSTIAQREDGTVFRGFDSFDSAGAIVHYITTTYVVVSAPSGSNSYSKCYITLRYTKTS